MIQQIEIQNFQSHEHTTVEPAPGLTVLVGSSNSGKTATLRALNWIAANRPAGASIVRQGSDGPCRAEVSVGGHTISRVRDKGFNGYKIDGEALEAVGRDVPQQVTDLLGLGEINVSRQLDPPFLVLDAPGRIAEVLNDAVHLGGAERAADAIGAAIRDLAARKKAAEGRAALAEEGLARLVRLPELAEAVASARSTADESGEVERALYNLGLISSGIRRAELELGKIKVPAGLGESVEYCEGTLKAIKTVEA